MKGSVQIAKVFGIPVQLHWSFAFIFLWLLYLAYSQSWDLESTIWAALFVLALFTCVIFHEFGHALTARRYGVTTRDIILSPIGGVARLDRLPDRPQQEFMVAIAGPLVNIAIAILLFPYVLGNENTRQQLLSILDPDSNIFFIELSSVEYFALGLFFLNGTLAVFNLVPAFPMDGGRILRALLSLKLGRVRATRIAAFIGQAVAIAFVAWGIWSPNPNLILVLVGLFVFMTAASESRMARLDGALESATVGDILRQAFTRIYRTDLMEKPLEEVTHGLEKNFLVFDEWQNLIGTLSERRLIEAIKKKDFGRPVGHYLDPHPLVLQPADSLKFAFHKIHWEGKGILPVYEQGRLIGVVDDTMINNFLQRNRPGWLGR